MYHYCGVKFGFPGTQCLTLTISPLYRDSLLLEAGFLTILVAPLNLFFWRKYVCEHDAWCQLYSIDKFICSFFIPVPLCLVGPLCCMQERIRMGG